MVKYRIVAAVGFILAVSFVQALAEPAPRISLDKLNAMLAESGPAVLDVRTEGSWEKSDKKIKGAIRQDPHNVGEWAGTYAKDETFVLYCS